MSGLKVWMVGVFTWWRRIRRSMRGDCESCGEPLNAWEHYFDERTCWRCGIGEVK